MVRRASWTVALLAAAAVTGASALQQPVASEMKSAFSAPEFRATADRLQVKLNFANAVAADAIGLVPVADRWDARLRETGRAVLGGVYLAKSSDTLRVGSGAYLVQASVDADRRATWSLIDANGTPKSVGLAVTVDRTETGEDIAVPIARIQSAAPKRRCCFKVDHIEHCGECN
jgi:hypothetical protein